MSFLKTIVGSAVAFTASLATFSVTAQAQEVTLRFQHFVSPQSANPKYFIEPWARKVEKDSNGRIKVEIYPFMQLGGAAKNQYDLVRDGVLDGGWDHSEVIPRDARARCISAAIRSAQASSAAMFSSCTMV